MIYPQCYNGTKIPFVAANGYLFPCCGVRNEKQVETINGDFIPSSFLRPEFNLYNKKYHEIVESNEWNNFIDNMYKSTVNFCHFTCGDNSSPICSSITPFNLKEKYNPRKVATKDINSILIELTTRCVLKCKYCSRNKVGKEILNRYDLSLDILDDVLSYKYWDNLIDCPNYGDSIFYKHYHEFLDMLPSYMIKYYKVSIAATGRPKQWWDRTHELWKKINRSKIKVIIYWGIDGLEDTSKIHRVGQNWQEITENMRIASSNGIESIWQFIPMSFNEHQIEEAKQLAKSWGVTFYIRPSERFKDKNDPWIPSNENLYYNMDIVNNKRVIKNHPKEEFLR